MLGEFQTCPKCKKGYMRPTAKEHDKVYLCDNDKCRNKLRDIELEEYSSTNRSSSVFSHYQWIKH
jgi:hypothetical protein